MLLHVAAPAFLQQFFGVLELLRLRAMLHDVFVSTLEPV